ncbi:MAG TPA: hypothetical protein VGP82_02495 [Ktedonobacterales bacterium]|nr:hypothetical protein [Ktedonobacterales bacterium]
MPAGPLGVVAFGDLADPRPGVAGTLGDGRRRLPRGQAPQHLPPGPLVRLVGRSLAPFKILDV